MPEQTISKTPKARIPGFDAEATPFLGLGLGLTGLALGLRPRMAALPLALTAVAALLYRDPQRTTPDEPHTIFAAADGLVQGVEELYEHRFLHTDAVRISVVGSPLDVPVTRSPAQGIVRYLERIGGEFRHPSDPEAAERNERTYIGIETRWGPLLIVQIAGPFARRLVCHVQLGDHVEAGDRVGMARFGGRTDLILPRDAVELRTATSEAVKAGTSSLGRVTTL